MTLMNHNTIKTRAILLSTLALSIVMSYRNLGRSFTVIYVDDVTDSSTSSASSTSMWPHHNRPWREPSNRTGLHAEIQPELVVPKKQQQQSPRLRCAINLYGLPRSFRHFVLPSIIENVIRPNRHYRCDYFIHFFNKTSEDGGRSGLKGTINPTDVFLLRDSVRQQHQQQQHGQVGVSYVSDHNPDDATGNNDDDVIVKFVADTDADFELERKVAIDQIVHNKNGTVGRLNPYMIHKMGTSTLLNVLKMWHSQTKVWELMETHSAAQGRPHEQRLRRNGVVGSHPIDDGDVVRPYYERVSMLRLDVIYMTPIDIYRVPYNPLPRDEVVLHPIPWPAHEVDYFWDNGTSVVTTATADGSNNNITNTTTNAMTIRRYRNMKRNNNQNVVIPQFASYPVNDRFIAGPYNAVKLWATGRWSRAYQHVHKVLPTYGLQKFGLHDERFVALTLIPEIQKMGQTGGTDWNHGRSPIGKKDISNSTTNNDSTTNGDYIASPTDFSVGPINVHADPAIYFLRVRADGAIWIRDSPIQNGEESDRAKLETILGRSCTSPFVVKKVVSAGRWQIKCPIV